MNPSMKMNESLMPGRLRCEYLVNPLGIDSPNPRFSWIVESIHNAQYQSAYRIMIASGSEALTNGKCDIWDSGRKESCETTNIPYGGIKLESRKRYNWRVQVWDKDGEDSTSEISYFETGLLDACDWQARWISGTDFSASPLFRRSFKLKGDIARARLYICGQGVYESFINGMTVGDEVLGPTLSYYSKRMYYDTYDVKDLLREGNNVIGAWLAPGWFGDCATWSEMEMKTQRHRFPYPAHALIAQLEIEYTDGTVEKVCTDEHWKTADSPLTPVKSNWKYCFGWSGEIFDAGKEEEGWNLPEFDDSGWEKMRYVPAPSSVLSARMMEPNRVRRVFEPVKAESVELTGNKDGLLDVLNKYGLYNGGTTFWDGVWFYKEWQKSYRESLEACRGKFLGGFVYDFGRHVSGSIEIKAKGRKGDSLIMFGVDCHRFCGKGVELVKLRFAHRAFRYAPVFLFGEGEMPEIISVRALDISNDVQSTGTFECSDEKLNEVSDVIKRTFEAQLLSGMMMDSWQERFGTFMPGEAALYNWNLSAFCRKLMTDYMDQQKEDGWTYVGAPISLGYTSLNSSFLSLPWLLYTYYGDREILEQCYGPIKKYADLILPSHDLSERTWRPPAHYIVRTAESGYGDHGRPGSRWYEPLEGDLFETMKLAGFYKNMMKAASVLGKEDDAEKYGRVATRLIDKCNSEKFLDRENGVYVSGDQGCHAVAEELGISPADISGKVSGWLVSDIMEKRGGHLNTGFSGTVYLMKALMRINRPDVAVSVITNETPPSAWSMLNHPMTPEKLTIMPEFWTGGMIPHPGLSTIGFWFYQALGGIIPDPEVPGFKHIIIKPQVEPSLTWVKAEYESIRGKISSRWLAENGILEMEVVIPANTTASIYVPGVDAHPKATDSGVKQLNVDPGGYTVFSVMGGRYCFSSKLTRLNK